MTAWAARYSATEEPELTIWRDGVEHDRMSPPRAADLLHVSGPACECGGRFTDMWWAFDHDTTLRDDIAARVPVRECEETQACARHAMPDGRCREHGGRDEL